MMKQLVFYLASALIDFFGKVAVALAYTFGVLLALMLMRDFATGAEISIPLAAEQHRSTLTKAARLYWGLDAPVAVFAAQVHTESRWNSEAKSPVGAQGLAQFMPTTAKWLPSVLPETGEPAPYSPAWSLRALCAYDRWLWDRLEAATAYERMAFTLSAYNGGQGWVNRDKRLAAKRGLDPGRWFGHVATVNAGRSPAAFAENRQYPRRILVERQGAYVKAGWGPGLEP